MSFFLIILDQPIEGQDEIDEHRKCASNLPLK